MGRRLRVPPFSFLPWSAVAMRLDVLRPCAVLLLLGLLAGAFGALPAMAACPDRPACRGCGCKGGPGYRGPDGRCVGFKDLAKVCGDPPETRCAFENAPGTGANRDCALGRPAAEAPALPSPPAAAPR